MVKQINIKDPNIYKIIDMVQQSIYWKDLNGTYLGCNKYMLNMIGYSDRLAVIGKTDYDLLWKDVAPELFKHDQQAIKTGNCVINEYYTNQLGLEKFYLTNKSRLLDDNGVIIGVVGTSMDITDRVHKEQLERENYAYKLREIEQQKQLLKLAEDIHYIMQNYRQKNLAVKLNRKASAIDGTHPSQIILTKRQQEVLYYLSYGLSAKEIAVLIGDMEKKNSYSAHTIHSIINKQLYKIFEVNSLGALLKRAGELKQIPFLLIDNTSE